MTITRELLRTIEDKHIHSTVFYGALDSFKNAVDAQKAKEWEDERPQLDKNGQWISARPTYMTTTSCFVMLLDEKKDTYRLQINIKKLISPSEPFPDAPVNAEIMELYVCGYGVAAAGNTISIFIEEDDSFTKLNHLEKEEKTIDIIMENQQGIEALRKSAKSSGKRFKKMMGLQR